MSLVIGPIVFDASRRTVSRIDGQVLPLTTAEWRLFAALVEAKGEPVHAERLFPAVLGHSMQDTDRSIRELVFKLRRKLPRDDDDLSLVRNHRGYGYWVRAPGQAPFPAPTPHLTSTGLPRFGQAAPPAPLTEQTLADLATHYATVGQNFSAFPVAGNGTCKAEARAAWRTILCWYPDLLAAARAGLSRESLRDSAGANA